MKKIILSLFVAFALIHISCEDELDRLTKFTITSKSTFTLPATTVVDVPLAIGTPEVPVSNQQEFDNNDSRTDRIESAKLTSLVLNITSPDDGNFNFLNEIEIIIDADGLEERVIAGKTEIPEGSGNSLELDVNDTELRPYLQNDSYSLKVRAKVDETIDSEYKIESTSKIFIDAKILGI